MTPDDLAPLLVDDGSARIPGTDARFESEARVHHLIDGTAFADGSAHRARVEAAAEADRLDHLADGGTLVEARLAGRNADQPSLEHENRDVAVARRVAAGRGQHGANTDLTPREVIPAELDAHVLGPNVRGQHLALRTPHGQAVVRGEHAVLFDQRSGARHFSRDDAHDVVVVGRESERHAVRFELALRLAEMRQACR